MNKFFPILCSFLLFLIFQVNAQDKGHVYLNICKTIDERVEDALSLMTLEEKVALCHAQSKFSSAGVPRLGIPELWMSDGPHGLREEGLWDSWSNAGWTSDSCTAFPALTCLAATFNPTLSYNYGIAIGEEARYRKKDILLGPGVNIYRTPMNGRNFEYMGEDPFLAAKMAVPYIQGVQQNGVAACVKHYALNNQEKWRMHINVNVSDRALHEIYLPAFKAAVEEGKVWSIMGSFSQLRGQYCCHNDLLLNKILKNDWQFDGVVISDWSGTHNTREAALNGLDIEMGSHTNALNSGVSNAYKDYFLATPFYNLLKNGEISASVLDDKVRRILRLIFRTNMNPSRPFGRFVCPDHSETALKVAEEGIVLLKNSKQFFPIPANGNKKIAIIGENATHSMSIGGGSSMLKVKYEVSPLQGLIAKYGKNQISYSLGYVSSPASSENVVNPDSLFNAAIETARTADIVLFIGGLNKNTFQDCEGEDRQSYNLPYGQDKLIEAISNVNKNMAVLLISGNAVAMPWVNKVAAIVQCWYLGSEAGNAIANVLSGDVNPSGKLPFSFSKKLEDNGANSFGKESYPGDSISVHYKEDILVGYRWFDAKKIVPQFAFGYGLSYTTFEYGKIISNKEKYGQDEIITLSFPLKNSGKVDGAEVAQVYATQLNASVLRPPKELKAFKKVFLRAGETQTMIMQIKVKDLAFYNEQTQSWTVEPGEFVLSNASAANEIKSSVNIVVLK